MAKICYVLFRLDPSALHICVLVPQAYNQVPFRRECSERRAEALGDDVSLTSSGHLEFFFGHRRKKTNARDLKNRGTFAVKMNITWYFECLKK